ncbi:hypothetical protein EU537_10990 [Candidatus Thorarchaeota archaeon]|nr:MAG: hypothetical protein EU537_10990 [Candidatus Thorarchaeota archaeon]
MTSIEHGLSHLTSRQVAIIMVIITLLIPYNAQFQGGQRSGDEWVVDVTIMAILWVLFPSHWGPNTGAFGSRGGGLQLLDPVIIINTLPLWIMNMLFAIQVIRFRQGDASKKSAIACAILTLVFPLLSALTGWSYVIEYISFTGNFVYIGPIPVQLIAGLVLVRFSENWHVTTPWKEVKAEEWWNEEHSR